jgi:hypothetical protein
MRELFFENKEELKQAKLNLEEDEKKWQSEGHRQKGRILLAQPRSFSQTESYLPRTLF